MASQGYTHVHGAGISDSTGALLGSGWISFTPVDNQGVELSYRVGSAPARQADKVTIRAQITGGAFAIDLADTSLTNPVNIGYRVTVSVDPTSRNLLGPGYDFIQPTGLDWNFDDYIPTTIKNLPSILGPVGLNFRGTWQPATAYATRDAFIAPDSSLYLVAGSPFTSGSTFAVNASLALILAPDVAANFKIAGIGSDVSRANRFDAGRAVPNSALLSSDGSLQTGHPEYTTTDFIYCADIPGIVINKNAGVDNPDYGFTWYDGNRIKVGYATAIARSAGAPYWFLRPDTAVYFRMFCLNGDVSTLTVLPVDTPARRIAAIGADVSRTNRFDSTRVLAGVMLRSADGLPEGNHAGYTATDYIYCADATGINVNKVAGVDSNDYGFTWFDANQVKIPGATAVARSTGGPAYFQRPQGAVYFRMFCKDSDLATLTVFPIAAGKASRWTGKNYGCVGDSITFNGSAQNNGGPDGYQRPLCAALSMTLALDNGVSGKNMADVLSDSGFTSVTNQQSIQNIDVLTLFLGTNDYGNGSGTPLGTMSSTGTDTFYGAVDSVINTFLTWKPTLRLAFITPTPRANMTNANGQGLTLAAYVEALKAKCRQYSIPYLNLFDNSGLNARTFATYTADGLHPNSSGYDACITPLLIDFIAAL